MPPNIEIAENREDLFRRAAKRFAGAAKEAARRNGRFAVALSGGGTPKGFYELLGQEPLSREIDWDQCRFFWGDERAAPPDDARSNFRMAREAFLSRVPIPEANVHRFEAELPDLEEAARRYEGVLIREFGLEEDGLPRFDQIWLGVGPDGHTASLFPGSRALDETERLACANWAPSQDAWRLTLTYPVLNRAAEVVFLAAGAEKADILRRIIKEGDRRLPAARVSPVGGRLVWLIDRDAAKFLS
ncbi:MAG TPA: 6-phosphogluconolactonase [Elusimicrobiota bacterium]|nr:6-phosphogluconolactonase [Elusimicrobiota bacterium]